jgi:type 2 lantibiotic biosynthesis protein LanM
MRFFFNMEALQWHPAFNLSERVAQFQGAPIPLSRSKHSGAAMRRVGEWRLQSPFEVDDWFQRRLALDGLDSDRLLGLLDEPVELMGERWPAPPEWSIRLLEALGPEAPLRIELPPTDDHQAFSSFLPAFEPLIQAAMERLRRGIRSLAASQTDLPFDPDTVHLLLYPGLPTQLGRIFNRTAALELFIAGVQKQLQGDSPAERFESFLQDLRDPERMLDFLSGYPVLARSLMTYLDLWVESSLEFLEHLRDDWEDVIAEFDPGSRGSVLEKVEGWMGDRHRGGRSVLVVGFSLGLRLVYKPKPLMVDRHFSEFLGWLNERGAPDLRSPHVLDRGSYGWSEFVLHKPCESRLELQRFFYRQGALLAVLYALEATDIHSENLIASGEYPVLVDLESLFHPSIAIEDRSRSDSMATSVMAGSVLRVGLLPQPQSGENGKTLDLSALGAREGQMSLWQVPVWEGVGTDQMRLVRKKMPMRNHENQPALKKEMVNPFEFSGELCKGFEAMYSLFVKHRDDLLSEDSPLARFATDETRVIFRNTRFYALILNESFHPHLLRNGMDRDQLFDRLFFGIEEKEPSVADKMLRLISSERADLWHGDIPYFRTVTGSTDIWNSCGAVLPGLLNQSGLDAVRARVQGLSEQDLRRQIWFLESALTALAVDTELRWTRYRPTKSASREVSREELIATASRIGDRLCELAIEGGDGDNSWIGLTIAGSHWILNPLGRDLYSGLPGIALFFAYLGKVTGNNEYTRRAASTLATLRKQIRLGGKDFRQVGAFEGWGGMIYTWTHLAALWGRDDLLDEAEGMLERVLSLVGSDDSFDLIGGSAGGICSLRVFHQVTSSERALLAMRHMGSRLIEAAQSQPQGLAWKSNALSEKPLTGFSHGTAGIALALLELNNLTGEYRWKETAEGALAFERSLFSAAAGNWPDLRGTAESGGNKYMTAWCHGAAGIGLSRLRMLELSPGDETLSRELQIAVETTLRDGFGGNHSLCHGDLGNLELIQSAGRASRNQQLLKEASRLTAHILASIQENGWACGVPLGVETPGLLPGIAGIGYGLLRQAEPDHVPSVLVLEPPPS